jgi:hypothetical protein
MNAHPSWLVIALTMSLCVTALVMWLRFLSRARRIEDTPTTPIRSAAQGSVELQGICEPFGEPLRAPLTGSACVWWEYRIERLDEGKGSRSGRWRSVSRATSAAPFRLRDRTGECLIEPDGATVHTSARRTWQGHSPWPKRPPSPAAFVLGGRARYRYTERWLPAGFPLYAMGDFRTRRAQDGLDLSKRVTQVLAAWKQDAAALAARFDDDGNGRIDADEWEGAREAARRAAELEYRRLTRRPAVNVLSAGEARRAPFVLSLEGQDELSASLRRRALLWFCIFLGAFAATGHFIVLRLGT